MEFPHTTRRSREHYASPDERFHLVFNAHPKFANWSDLVRAMIWRSTIEQRDAGRIQLFAACLMPDHLHLLVGPTNDDLIAFENAWKSWTTRQSWKLGNKNALWQPGMWDRTIRPDEDFEDVAMYIVRNPVVAGFVDDESDWPHSAVWWWEA